MIADAEQRGPSSGRTTQGSSRRSCLAALLGAAAAIVVTLVLAGWWVSRNRLPMLDREGFDGAWAQWQENGPASYMIRTKVVGPQPATYECTVANGNVVAATRNGQPLKDHRTLGTWSVPGMFDTMEYDVNALYDEHRTAAEKARVDLLLRAEFDQRMGYPSRYLRSDFVMKTTMIWEVVEFREINNMGRDEDALPSTAGPDAGDSH